ncbi:MAG: flavin reductase family protein, partial [Pseudolysinimonas sp.]
RLPDALAWFDARIEQEVPLGDHVLVVGRVRDAGTGDADAGLPLLFRRAGYGSFQVPSTAVDAPELGRRIRLAEGSREIVATLAESLGVEVMLSAVVHDSVVVLSVTRPAAHPGEHPSQQSVGVSFPFAAPLAPVFVAWAAAADRSAWIESSRHLVGAVDREGLARTLDSVRRRGYNVSTDRALGARFDRLVRDDGAGRESFARFWSDLAAENEAVLRSGEIVPERVSSIQAPVFGHDGGVALVVNANGFEGLTDIADVEAAAAEVVAAATAISARADGREPSPAAESVIS